MVTRSDIHLIESDILDVSQNCTPFDVELSWDCKLTDTSQAKYKPTWETFPSPKLQIRSILQPWLPQT
jgi:hypothetical protein